MPRLYVRSNSKANQLHTKICFDNFFDVCDYQIEGRVREPFRTEDRTVHLHQALLQIYLGAEQNLDAINSVPEYSFVATSSDNSEQLVPNIVIIESAQ